MHRKGTICGGCKQRCARLRFSNKQWTQYTQRKYNASAAFRGPKKVEPPLCRSCSGEPPTEKKCVVCEKLLALEKFSKNARKNKDNSVSISPLLRISSHFLQKCINCTQQWEDLEADPDAAVTEQRLYDELEETGVSKIQVTVTT